VPPWISVCVAAVVFPMPIVVVLVVPTLTVPAPVLFKVRVPVPLDCKEIPVFVVLGLITGLAPEKVRAVELSVSVLIVPLVTTLPVRVIPAEPLWITVDETVLVEPMVVV